MIDSERAVESMEQNGMEAWSENAEKDKEISRPERGD